MLRYPFSITWITSKDYLISLFFGIICLFISFTVILLLFPEVDETERKYIAYLIGVIGTFSMLIILDIRSGREKKKILLTVVLAVILAILFMIVGYYLF